MPKIVFFGSSRFSELALDELEKAGFSPVLKITNARDPLPQEAELKALEPDLIVVASFGKILPMTLLDLPRGKSLNIHPSLLPRLRGPAPIQGTILGLAEPGVTIIRMDEKMDHGPIVAQEKAELSPWPDHYAQVEEKLARLGGSLLARIIPDWLEGKIKELPQAESEATYIKMVKKEDGLISPEDPAEENLRKVLAYSSSPGAYLMFKRKTGQEIRVIVREARIESGRFLPLRVIPAGRKEMDWEAFLRGNA